MSIYYFNGRPSDRDGRRRIDLAVLPGMAVVRGPKRAVQSVARACAPLPIEIVYDSTESPGDPPMLLLRGHEEALARLPSTGKIRFWDVYVQPGNGPDHFKAPSGMVSLQLKGTGWTKVKANDILQPMGLTVTEAIDGMDGGFFAVTSGDPIDAARRLVEDDKVLFAEPDFVRKGSRRDAPRMGNRGMPGRR